MLAFCGSQLTARIARLADGSLLCRGAILAQTGTAKYIARELGIADSDDLVTVHRTPEEVCDPAAVASFEGCTLTLQHPPAFLNPQNWHLYAKGHVQHCRVTDLPTGEKGIVGDLIVNDAALIQRIESGLRSLSAGYDCVYIKLEDGSYAQCNIRGNHVSVVPKGRWTSTKIMDSENKQMDTERINERLDTMISILRAALRGQSTRRTLADETGEIVRDAKDTEQLMRRPGLSANGFAAELARRNEAYATYDAEQRSGAEYEAMVQAAGERMRDQYLPKEKRSCRVPVTDHGSGERDWAEAVNAAGRRLRGR